MLNVQLHYLIAGAGPGVFDVHARDHLARGSHGIGRQAQVGVLEYGIAEAESEGIQGLPFEIHIGTTLPNVVVHHGRQIVQRLDPCGHQPAGRIIVAEQHIRQSAAF